LLEVEKNQIIDFREAAGKIQHRPWLIDDLDKILDKIESYKSVAIFVDNSGADVIFGILPFARELAKQGSTVSTVKSIINSRYGNWDGC